MPFTDDEQALRTALRDLTTGQPTLSVDLASEARRRYHRRVRIQAAVAVVATVGVTLAALVGVGTFSRAQPPFANRPVPGWALPWPDHRDGSVPQRVLDGAVTAWRDTSDAGDRAPRPAPRSVTWYVGQLTANGGVVAVVFEVDDQGKHRLVAGWASASEVLAGQPPYDTRDASGPWVLYDVPAPSRKHASYVGLNVHGESTRPNRNPDNWVLILTRPETQYLELGAASVGLGPGPTGRYPVHAGLAIIDTGQLESAVQFSARLPTGFVIGGNVGVPGAPQSFVPQLARAAALVGVPASPNGLGELTGQGSSTTSDAATPDGLRTTIYARCFWGPAITVTVDAGPGVSVRCDNRQHQLPGPALRAGASPLGKGHSVAVAASPYDSWRVAVVAHR